jgi:hypothetical protein
VITYRRVAVASTFSPTFAAVLAEASCFARHCGADLEVLHAAAYGEDKERRFREVIGADVPIHWVENDNPAHALLSVAGDYELLIAGAMHREDAERPYTSGVARELLRSASCDLLLVPRPSEQALPPEHIVFALEPGEASGEFLKVTVEKLRPKRATIAITQTPFAAAIASSRGEKPPDVEAWLEELGDCLADSEVDFDERRVSSNTGYNLCEAIEGLGADFFVVQAESDGALPLHMNWLYQVIPTRLLVVRKA